MNLASEHEMLTIFDPSAIGRYSPDQVRAWLRNNPEEMNRTPEGVLCYFLHQDSDPESFRLLRENGVVAIVSDGKAWRRLHYLNPEEPVNPEE